MGKKYKRHKKSSMSKWIEKVQDLDTKDMVIFSSAIIGAIFIIGLLVMFVIASKTRDFGNDGNAQVASEEMTADENLAAGEDMPVVETATEGTKSESTPDTTILAKKEGAKDGYLNRCVFLGDSRTVAMVNYGFFNDDAALAQIGISHPSFASNKFINNAGKEYTLKSYLSSHQAPVIYILLGVNGINDPSQSHYEKTFISLIDKVIEMAPNSNIVLVAIGPVDDNGIYKNTVQNKVIDIYNDFLLKTAREKHIYYLNIAEILKGSDGQVKAEYNGGDGLHYSGSGCEAIFKYIVEHPVPGISDDGKYVVKYIKPDPNRIKVTMGKDSGIDEDKLEDLMKMMGAEGSSAASESSTVKSDEAASEGSSLTEEEKKKAEEKKKKEEEEKKKAEEEKKKKEEEEKKKKEEEEEEAKKKAEEEEKKKAEEEEAKKKAEEEEAKKKAEEEEKKKAEEENGEQSASEATSKAASFATSEAASESTAETPGGGADGGNGTDESTDQAAGEAGNTP